MAFAGMSHDARRIILTYTPPVRSCLPYKYGTASGMYTRGELGGYPSSIALCTRQS